MAMVALFDPCYLGVLRPTDAEHALRVLRALGDEPVLLDGRCCGQPAFNSGFRDEARTVGRGLLRAARQFDSVVTTSGSCTAMASHYLPALFPGQRSVAATRLGQRFREFSSYVALHPAIDSLPLALAGVVVYHDSCHVRRELSLTDTVVGLLSRVQGLELRRLEFEAECCGFGGAFSVKLPDVSVAMMTRKLDDVRQSGAHVLVSTDMSCLAHLEAGARGIGLPLETWSIAELLSRALP